MSEQTHKPVNDISSYPSSFLSNLEDVRDLARCPLLFVFEPLKFMN